MDPYIKRLKQLTLALALAGLFSHYAIDSYEAATQDFEQLQNWFFASLLLSQDHQAQVNWFEDEFARDGYTRRYDDVENGRQAANVLIGEETYLFKGWISVNGVRFGFENVASINLGQQFYDVGQQNDNGQQIEVARIEAAPSAEIGAMLQDNGRFLEVQSNVCPDFRVAIEYLDLIFTCFHLWRTDDQEISSFQWLVNGRPYWTGGDFIVDDHEPYLVTASQYMSEEEIDSRIAFISERNNVSGENTSDRYFGFRYKILGQRFKVPIVGIETDITDYYRLLVIVSFIFSVLLLHSSTCFLDSAANGRVSEPWILIHENINLSPTGIVRASILSFGVIFYLCALALPVSALLRFAWELNIEANLIIDVSYITGFTIILLIGALIYVGRAVIRQANT